MKKLTLLAFILISINSFANCNVYVPVNEVVIAGMPIRFDFTAAFYPKKYLEVRDSYDASYELQLEANELQGRFQKAEAKFKLIDREGRLITEVTETKTCLTQLCSVRDFAKAFSKAYQVLGKRLPACKQV